MELKEALLTMLWYEGYCDVIQNMLEKINNKEYDIHIPYDEENGFSQEVWSVFVLMFGEYGTAPRVGWIENIAEFKKCLENILDWMHKDDPEYEDYDAILLKDDNDKTLLTDIANANINDYRVNNDSKEKENE